MVPCGLALLMVVCLLCAATTGWVLCTGPLPPIYMQSQTTSIRQLQWYYNTGTTSKEGLYHIYGGHNVGAKEWSIATGGNPSCCTK